MIEVISKQRIVKHLINNLISSGKKIKQTNIIYNIFVLKKNDKISKLLKHKPISKQKNFLLYLAKENKKYTFDRTKINKIFNYIILKITTLVTITKINRKIVFLSRKKRKKNALHSFITIIKKKKSTNIHKSLFKNILLIIKDRTKTLNKKRVENKKILFYKKLFKYFKKNK